MTANTVIAIDGPAASGKSTVSRAVAARLGLAHVNTGAMYRAVTWRMLEDGVPMEVEAIRLAVASFQVECHLKNLELSLRINGVDPLPFVRDPKINTNVSLVASVPEVRALLVTRQRELAGEGSVVMEGRDMGSVVFPETPFKFYIDADEEVRARRRQAQGELDVIQDRDKMDSSRTTAPLTLAPGAVLIDTTHLSIEQAIAKVLQGLHQKGLQVA